MHLRVLIGSALILAALGAVAVLSFYSNQVAYFTVDQFAASPDAQAYQAAAPNAPGPRLQLRGEVDPETIERPSEGLEMTFELTGKADRVEVVYHGVVPDTFEMAESVTVGGSFHPDGTFVADELFVQCPSKYEAVPSEESAVSQNG
jgi:cytochrome c-type biogenesis protein CcmE